jgi:phosphate-selective porin
MGFAPKAFVNLRFHTWYAVLSQSLGRNRLSARYDVFQTDDRDHSFAEINSERGRAWTFAWFFEPHPTIRLGAEFASISAQRAAAAQSGFDPNTDGRTLTIEARYRF